MSDLSFLHSQSLAPSTRNTYNSAYQNYNQFCHQCRLPLFPLSCHVLQFYVTSLARRVSYKTIKVYLAGIQFYSYMSGYQETITSMIQLFYLLRGIRRVQGSQFSQVRRSPITIRHLYQLVNHIQVRHQNPHDQYMLHSAITLAFAGLLRSAEFVSHSTTTFDPDTTLLVSDIRLSANIIHVSIKSSKTDPFKRGCIIRIGATGGLLCPVQAITNFIQLRGSGPGPLYQFRDGSYLTRRYLSQMLQTEFPNANLNTHSFRIGGASAAAAAGIQDSAIQLLGRWSSDAYRRYLHLSDDTVLDFSRRLFATNRFSRYWDSVHCRSQAYNEHGERL